ncbi:MAG TPA: 3-isopropylmalate dehydratase small subunit [Phototrophicaceae bacterium]|jgi:3-isopropylmalate/(R)-2-methylmalate dehydratase small subunit|nr:3-isopropylmalate dehydratase small subunit [Phototrophicaceae bacterium]
MEPFKYLKSKPVPFDIVNVDTDQIIPKQFLKLLGKTGYGKYLFYNWRYDKNGNVDSNFVINLPEFAGREILLTREYFGIGSSREHAVWALKDFGFKVILGISFADIFYNNCFKNGVLAIMLDKDKIDDIFSSKTNRDIEVDLPNQTVKIDSDIHKFEIDSTLKHYLLEGIDEISTTLKYENYIRNYELKNKSLVMG